MDISKQLQKPLDRKHVKQRKGPGGIQLSYLEGWRVIEELNLVFGFDGWSRETVYATCVFAGEQIVRRQDKDVPIQAVTYIAKVRIEVNFPFGKDNLKRISREGTGTGHGMDDRYIGLAHESAIKEAETDAFKRAAMTLGYRLGLALYDKNQKHVTDSPEAKPQEKVVAETDQLKVEDDATLIDCVIDIADWIGEFSGDPEYAYNTFLGYTQNGEERVTTAPVLIAWKKKPLTQKKRAFLSARKDKMIKEHPGAEVACQDIGF